MTPRTFVTPSSGVRWRILAFFFCATVVSYLDRQALSVNAPVIREQYGLSNAQYSQLVSAFLVAYTLGQPLAGTWSTGSEHGWRSPAACSGGRPPPCSTRPRAASGTSHCSGSCWGSARRARFPRRSAASPSGSPSASDPWRLASSQVVRTIGALLAPPLVAFLTIQAGVAGVVSHHGRLGLIWLVFWWRFYALPEQHKRLSEREREHILADRRPPGEATRATLWRLLCRRQPWGIIAGRFLVDPVWWFYVFWLPSYLSDVRGFTLAQIGWFAWIPFLAADAGTFVGGWLSGRLLGRTTLSRARKIVLFLGAAGTLFGIPASQVGNAAVCLLLISIVTFSIGMWATLEVTVAADILPASAVGSMTGLSGAGAALGGILFTSLTGWIVNRFSTAVFVLASVLPLAGFALLATLMGEIGPLDLTGARPDTRREPQLAAIMDGAPDESAGHRHSKTSRSGRRPSAPRASRARSESPPRSHGPGCTRRSARRGT